MNTAIKTMSFCTLFALMGYSGFSLYHYFFNTGYPSIEIMHLIENIHYNGTVTCSLEGYDDYKVTDISLTLDDTPLLKKHKVNARKCSIPYNLVTTQLSNGPHKLTVQATNGTYTAREAKKEYSFFVDNEPLRASVLRPDSGFKVLQGRTVHVKIQCNKNIKEGSALFSNQEFPCFAQSPHTTMYECFIPISCEEKAEEQPLKITLKDAVGNQITLTETVEIMPAQFKKQQLSVDAEKVKREKELGLSHEQLQETIEHLTRASAQEKLWQGSFYAPCEIKNISTEYGAVRITQERGKYYHKAVDINGTPKSIIWAPQRGKVVLKERFALSGNTVVIDHGFNILSLFFHLDEFAPTIKVGDIIQQGNPLGTLGKTGYATGYHLHWEMRVNNIAIDPLQWISPTF